MGSEKTGRVACCRVVSSMCELALKVNNGVRQGGIISPRLFNLYMDKLSMKLNSVNVGCCIKSLVINHLMYADDLALIAPSVKGLQTILDICYEYGLSHNIKFNESKSVCMHFKVALPCFQ